MIQLETVRLTAIYLQGAVTAPAGSTVVIGSTMFMVFVALVAVSILFQTITMIMMAVGAGKTQKEVLRIANEMRSKTVPVLEITRSILEDTGPKIKVISDNALEASYLLKDQAVKLDHSMSDLLNTVQVQVERVDGIVSDTLNNVESVTQQVTKGVMGPVKQVSGLVNGVKAGIENLIRNYGRRSADVAETVRHTDYYEET